MARGAVQIKLFGLAKTTQMFRKLPNRMQNKIAARALKASVKRLRGPIANAAPQGETGLLKVGLRTAKVHSETGGNRNIIRYVFDMPTREFLHIPPFGSPGGSGYYPFSIEYGWDMKTHDGTLVRHIPPRPYIRNTTDGLKAIETRLIAKQILRETEIEARKLGAKPK